MAQPRLRLPSAQVFFEELVQHRLVLPTGVLGVFGRSSTFEDVLGGLDRAISRAMGGGYERMLFPPVMSRHVVEETDYLESFPHLPGAVMSFVGGEGEHVELLARVRASQSWAELLAMTAVVLVPAACYPLYPSLTGSLPSGGRFVDMQNWVFRHEPSSEPTRMLSFRVRELVRMGMPDEVLAWRDECLARGTTLLRSLGLEANAVVAADPFFGRAGRMLASSQKERSLKFEVVVPLFEELAPTAVASFNYHGDHFGKRFGIASSDGAVAESACLGFGLERVVMALFRAHGFAPAGWPAEVRQVLWA